MYLSTASNLTPSETITILIVILNNEQPDICESRTAPSPPLFDNDLDSAGDNCKGAEAEVLF